MSSTRIIEYYLRIVALVLASTALAKVVSISLTAPLLDRPDDLVGFLTLRQVLLVAALLEIGVIRFLLEKRSAGDRLLAVAWLSTIFAAYRLGLRVVGHTGYCACLGSLPKLLGVGERYSDDVMFGHWHPMRGENQSRPLGFPKDLTVPPPNAVKDFCVISWADFSVVDDGTLAVPQPLRQNLGNTPVPDDSDSENDYWLSHSALTD